MKLVLVVISAIVLAAYADVISMDDLLKAYYLNTNEIGDNSVQVANQALYVPMNLRSCTSGACNFVCKFLGYKYGTCVSSETCRCYS
nr:uncharacterized protein LOC110371017 [Helicoverpa armigera]